MEDLIGLLILIAVALALLAALIGAIGLILAYLGMAVLLLFDLLSCSLSWLRIGPVAGWFLMGALLGVFFGLVTGMKANGRASQLRTVYIVATTLFVLLLVAGFTSPAFRNKEASRMVSPSL